MEKKGLKKYATVGFTWLFVAAGTIAVASWQGLHTFVFAWVVNFLLMTALMAYTETFQPPLQSSYFATKKLHHVSMVRKLLQGITSLTKTR